MRHSGPDHHPTVAEALQLREAQLRGLLETASEGIITTDANQVIVMANRAAADMFRCRVEDLIGAPLERLIPEPYRRQHHDDVLAFGTAESPPRRMGERPEIVGLRADGEAFPLAAGISHAHVDGERLYTVILHDLSGARRAAAALNASERMLAATFSASSVGIVHMDPATRRFTAVNAAFCALCGYDAAELVQMDPDRLNHPEDSLDPAKNAALLQGAGRYLEEKRLLRKDGTMVWVQVSGSVVRGDDGKPLRVVGVVHDITARREAEAVLRAREARMGFRVRLNDRLRSLDDPRAIAQEAAGLLCEFLSASRVGYAEFSDGGSFVTIGASHARDVPALDGRQRIRGPALMQLIRAGHTIVRDDVAADPALSAQEKAAFAEVQVGAAVAVPVGAQATGRAMVFVHAAHPRRWAAEEVALIEEVAQRTRADIERARAETRLRTAKATLEAALESMTDAVTIADTQGHFVEVNSAFAAFHRCASKAECPRELSRYMSLFEVSLRDGSLLPPSQWAVPRALRGESSAELLCEIRRTDTGERWSGSYSYAPVRGEGGAIVGAVVVARDVTELNRMHAELQASHDELQHLIDAQDQVQEGERLRIARELHDDLQQGLAAILMEAAAVRQNLRGRDGPAERGLLAIERIGEQVIASTRRIVQDLRPQILEDLGLPAALEALASQFTQRTGVRCTVDTDGLGRLEEARLAPVAACLYRVAQEAMNNIGKHAAAREVRIVLARPAERALCLSIADDGRGMAADGRRAPGAYGLLGMRERLRAVGGVLRVASEAGRGTTLEAEVPWPQAAA